MSMTIRSIPTVIHQFIETYPVIGKSHYIYQQIVNIFYGIKTTNSFGGDWNKVEASPPTNATFNSQKKTPPRPPLRQYFPYSSASSLNNENRSQFGRDNTPLASSPSYFATQLKVCAIYLKYVKLTFIHWLYLGRRRTSLTVTSKALRWQTRWEL